MTRIPLVLLVLQQAVLLIATYSYYLDKHPIHHAGHHVRGPRLYDTECTEEAFKQYQQDNHRISDEHDEEKRARLCEIIERNKERRTRRDAGLDASNDEGTTSMSDLSDEEYQSVLLQNLQYEEYYGTTRASATLASEAATLQPNGHTTVDTDSSATDNTVTSTPIIDVTTDESETQTVSESEENIPAEFDWRDYGFVTPVKSQGLCASCWAFATVAAIQSAMALKSGTPDKFPALSEQHLVDCSVDPGENGCHGSWPSEAMEFVASNGGISTEQSYPYANEHDEAKHECKVNQETVDVRMKGPKMLKAFDEESLKRDLLLLGPIVITFDANHSSFKHHLSSGVYNEPECDPYAETHAMLLVGYGTDAEKGDYWTIKNSWGTGWGEDGFLRSARNKDNRCGVATRPVIPEM